MLKMVNEVFIPDNLTIVSDVETLKKYECGTLFIARDNTKAGMPQHVYMLCKQDNMITGKNKELFFVRVAGNYTSIFKCENILPVNIAPYGTKITINQC